MLFIIVVNGIVDGLGLDVIVVVVILMVVLEGDVFEFDIFGIVFFIVFEFLNIFCIFFEDYWI